MLLFALIRGAAATLGRAFESARRWRSDTSHWYAAGPIRRASSTTPLAVLDDDSARVADPEPQLAVTHYSRLARLELDLPDDRHPTSRYALVELSPETGRRHQLRRHLKHIAHPIVGDATYGKGPRNRALAARVGVTRLWLHARSLSFAHPETGEPLTIQAPLGEDWQRLLALPGWIDPVSPPG